jgi:hypothetical protein
VTVRQSQPFEYKAKKAENSADRNAFSISGGYGLHVEFLPKFCGSEDNANAHIFSLEQEQFVINVATIKKFVISVLLYKRSS